MLGFNDGKFRPKSLKLLCYGSYLFVYYYEVICINLVLFLFFNDVVSGKLRYFFGLTVVLTFFLFLIPNIDLIERMLLSDRESCGNI
jgi:hypothetical protein